MFVLLRLQLMLRISLSLLRLPFLHFYLVLHVHKYPYCKATIFIPGIHQVKAKMLFFETSVYWTRRVFL